jgi:hypothetical protein
VSVTHRRPGTGARARRPLLAAALLALWTGTAVAAPATLLVTGRAQHKGDDDTARQNAIENAYGMAHLRVYGAGFAYAQVTNRVQILFDPGQSFRGNAVRVVSGKRSDRGFYEVKVEITYDADAVRPPALTETTSVTVPCAKGENPVRVRAAAYRKAMEEAVRTVLQKTYGKHLIRAPAAINGRVYAGEALTEGFAPRTYLLAVKTRVGAANTAAPAAAATPPPRNVMIEVDRLVHDSHDSTAAGFLWRYADKHVRAGTARPARHVGGGLNAIVFHGNVAAALSTARSRGRSRRVVTESVMALDGHPAMIAVGGTSVVNRRVGLVTRHGVPRVRVPMQVRHGETLTVLPRILDGGLIEVRLTRASAELLSRKDGSIDHTRIASRVVVPDGGSVLIGGLSTASTGTGSDLTGKGVSSARRSVSLVLRPRIVRPVVPDRK